MARRFLYKDEEWEVETVPSVRVAAHALPDPLPDVDAYPVTFKNRKTGETAVGHVASPDLQQIDDESLRGALKEARPPHSGPG